MFRKLTVAEKFGPGTWSVLHSIALNCDKLNRPEMFIDVFVIIVENFQCMVCRVEAKKYTDKYSLSNIIFNPIKIYSGFDTDNLRSKYPCSHYINSFHNFVNQRLGKNMYDLSKSIDLTKKGCKECHVK